MDDQKRDKDSEIDYDRYERDGHGEEGERINAFRGSHVD